MAINKRQWEGGEAFQVDLMVRGKRVRRQFPTLREAKAFELETRQQAKMGTFRAGADKLTLRKVLPEYERYIADRRESGRRMTRAYYEGIRSKLKNYIMGGVTFTRKGEDLIFESRVSDVRLTDIDQALVEEWMNDLAALGNDNKTVRDIKSVLGGIFKWAIRKRLVGVDPTRGATMLALRNHKAKKRIVVPPKDLVQQMIVSAKPSYRTLFIFAVLTGVRAGEQYALRWRHVDLEAAEVRVETRVDRYGVEDGQGTKTDAGNRSIPLAPELCEMLRQLREASRWSKDDDLVFPNTKGTFWDHGCMKRDKYRPLYKQTTNDWPHGTPVPKRPRWHDLRHFAVSCWIEQGFVPMAIQEFAGHENLSTTMGIYGHLFPSEKHRVGMAEIADSLLPGRP